MEEFKTQLSQVEDSGSTVNPPSPRKTRHSMNGTVNRKRRASDASIPKARGKTIRKVESVTKSYGAPVAFGRVLAPLFGSPSPLLPGNKPGSAFLILDHAERLFSLSTSQKAEPNNFLAQLLLLPQVMGLNLTLIIVSRSTLLDCSREYLVVAPSLVDTSHSLTPISIVCMLAQVSTTLHLYKKHSEPLQMGSVRSECTFPPIEGRQSSKR